MKKSIYKLFIAAMVAAAFASCEDVLESKPVNEFEDGDVWRIPELAEGTLLTVYGAMPAQFDAYDGNFLDVATDNAATRSFGSGVYKISTGALNTVSNPMSNWETCYTQLQTIHMFMERGLGDGVIYDKVDGDIDAQIKKRLLGECHFLRAWWNFALLQMFGGRTDDGQALGIPMVDHFITPQEAAHPENFRRETYARCVELIMEDCDKAIENLPNTYTGSSLAVGTANIGRANAMAARVLKSRVALYGASPAYRPASEVAIVNQGEFTVADAAAYEAGWQSAALVAHEVLQTAGFGNFTALTHANIANPGENAATPADFVFRFYYVNNGIETRHFPPFYYGNAQTVPSQNLVDAFPSKSGFPISDSRALYDETAPYAMARDNRFDLNIYYHGRTFATNSGKIDVSYGGKDSPAFNERASRTGYYLSKFLARQDNMLVPTTKVNWRHYTPLLRKSEVFYNFAEASNEAYGPTGKGPGFAWSAYDIMKITRTANGINSNTYLDEVAADGKDAFRELIQNERRLEFAFENQRFFDMRRWLLRLDDPIRGVRVTNNAGTFEYSFVEIEPRRFDGVRSYYMPLPYAELMKNPNLKNNMGWDIQN
jgi:hypothetical protein